MFDINVDIKKLNDPEKLAQKVRILQKKYDAVLKENEELKKYTPAYLKHTGKTYNKILFENKYLYEKITRLEDELKNKSHNDKLRNENITNLRKRIKESQYIISNKETINDGFVVYAYYCKTDLITPAYIGSTRNLATRDAAHLKGTNSPFDLIYNDRNDFELKILCVCDNESIMRCIEKFLIKALQPKYNVVNK